MLFVVVVTCWEICLAALLEEKKCSRSSLPCNLKRKTWTVKEEKSGGGWFGCPAKTDTTAPIISTLATCKSSGVRACVCARAPSDSIQTCIHIIQSLSFFSYSMYREWLGSPRKKERKKESGFIILLSTTATTATSALTSSPYSCWGIFSFGLSRPGGHGPR